jgi:hypothetical protein
MNSSISLLKSSYNLDVMSHNRERFSRLVQVDCNTPFSFAPICTFIIIIIIYLFFVNICILNSIYPYSILWNKQNGIESS